MSKTNFHLNWSACLSVPTYLLCSRSIVAKPVPSYLLLLFSLNALAFKNSKNSYFYFQSKAEYIAIVAHSFGGIVTCKLADHFLSDFEERVFAVMLTDSVHQLDKDYRNNNLVKLLSRIGLNFVASNDVVGTDIPDDNEAIPMVSAGHSVHEWTSATCKEKLFERLKEKFAERKQQQPRVHDAKADNESD